MTEPDPCLDEHARIALNAYQDCLKACAAFEGFFLPQLEHSADQVWWKTTFENHSEELSKRIQNHLLEAMMTGEGCLELGATRTSVTTPAPRRLHWRGHRQKVYQLVAWGLLGEVPTKRSVVRHLCKTASASTQSIWRWAHKHKTYGTNSSTGLKIGPISKGFCLSYCLSAKVREVGCHPFYLLAPFTYKDR